MMRDKEETQFAKESEGWRRDAVNDSFSLRARGIHPFPSTMHEGPLPAVALECRSVHDRFPGVYKILNVMSKEEASCYVKGAEALGFSNAHHPDYQSRDIDMQEESYRRNDRVVYRAAPEEVALLYKRLAPFLPSRMQFEDLGEFELCGLNDMWRFYKYRPAESEEDAKEGRGQSFPVHRDNATFKDQRHMSTHSVLIYLAGDDLGGGQTAFYEHPRAEPTAVVQPLSGQAVIFHHLGKESPLHAGLAPWRIDGTAPGSCKYVLRSDAMYRRVGPVMARMPYISPPYDKRPWVPHDAAIKERYGVEIKRCSDPFCQKLAGKIILQCSRCHKATYCSQECQRRSWRQHKHCCHR